MVTFIIIKQTSSTYYSLLRALLLFFVRAPLVGTHFSEKFVERCQWLVMITFDLLMWKMCQRQSLCKSVLKIPTTCTNNITRMAVQGRWLKLTMSLSFSDWSDLLLSIVSFFCECNEYTLGQYILCVIHTLSIRYLRMWVMTPFLF